MSGAPLKYKSAIQGFIASMPWDVPMGFLDERGPNGGWVVIDFLELVVNFNVSTGAGVTTTAADAAAGLVGLFEVYEGVAVAERYRLPGLELRHFCIMNTQAHPTDPAALIANTANQTGTLTLLIPFAHPLAARPKDTSIHAFDLREGGGGIRITMPAAWSANFAAGGTPTINAATTYQIIAHGHEEAGLELKTRWEVGFQTTVSVTDLELAVSGKLLAFASLYISGAGGGSSLANLVDVTSNDYGWKQIAVASFIADYVRERDSISNPPSAIDPVLVAGPKAMPLVFRSSHQKITDHRSNAQKMLFRCTSTLGSNPSILTMFVTERLAKKTSALIAAAGISKPVLISKTRASLAAPGMLGQWSDYLPLKVVQDRG